MGTQETKNYADLSAFETAASGVRRYKDVEIQGLGLVQLRSLESSEYLAIEAVLTRAGVAARQNKPKTQQELTETAYAKLLLTMVCNGQKDPLFKDSEATRAMLKRLDAAASQKLVSECLKHAGLDEEELDDLAKK